MKEFLLSRQLAVTMRLLLGAVFLYAGLSKILETQSFADSIDAFRLLPNLAVNIFAIGIPPFEIVVGTMMLIGWKEHIASLSIILLLLIFVLALFQALVRGLNIDCGCFGSESPSVWNTWEALGRDLILISAAILAYVRSKMRNNHQPSE